MGKSTGIAMFLFAGLSACTGKHCIFGHLGLFFIWSCFVFCLLFLLFYVICAPVPAEGTFLQISLQETFKGRVFWEKQVERSV